MKNNRKKYSAQFKSKVALMALSELKTIPEIAEEFEIHPSLVSKWKAELKNNATNVFSDKIKNQENQTEKKVDNLYKQVGKLQVENDWLKKKVGYSS